MPVIKVDNRQYALRPGPNRVGLGDVEDVRVDPRAVLATLEVTSSGLLKGQMYDTHVPLAHVGGSHNDIVIQDDSVSDMPAKLQRRDDGYVVGAGSTNVTYVDGQRLSAERPLDGALRSRVEGRTGIPESVPASSTIEPAAQGFSMLVWIVVALAIAGAAALFALNR